MKRMHPHARFFFVGTQQQIADVKEAYGNSIDYVLQEEIPNMSHKKSPNQAHHGKAHGQPIGHGDMHPHASATKHTPRGSAGTRPTQPGKSQFARRMRGLEGAHGSGQNLESERREKRLTGKPV